MEQEPESFLPPEKKKPLKKIVLDPQDPNIPVEFPPNLQDSDFYEPPLVFPPNQFMSNAMLPNQQLLLFQLPNLLPVLASDQPQSSNNNTTNPNQSQEKKLVLQSLPDGKLGKILVFKSGKIKLKIGDFLFDVRAGAKSSSYQEVVTVDVTQKECCALGTFTHQYVCVPDVADILSTLSLREPSKLSEQLSTLSGPF